MSAEPPEPSESANPDEAGEALASLGESLPSPKPSPWPAEALEQVTLTKPSPKLTAKLAAKPTADISPASGLGSGGLELAKARELAKKNKWEEIVQLLTPKFSSRRDRGMGMLLADAYLKQKKPQLAKEIVDTLEFDKEIMADDLKDLLYRVGVALEDAGKSQEALALYDLICNVDINFRDTFDRSDNLYNKCK